MSSITVTSTTQRIIVDPYNNSVAVINAGPPGPGVSVVWELYAEYTTPGTYSSVTLPADAVEAEFRCVAPGVGGASGRRGLTTEIRAGGGSGAGGMTFVMPIRDSALDESYTIVVPAGTNGAAGIAADNTNGSSPSVPSALTITGSVSGLIAYGYPATAPGGGGLGVAGGASTGRQGMEVRADGVASLASGAGSQFNPTNTSRSASGGGAGGGLTAANAASSGGNGAGVLSRNQIAGGGSTGAIGGNGYSPSLADRKAGALGGGGGGGGGSAAAGQAGNGGNGGYPGGGGGGGGASSNGNLSGAGGKGGDGYVGIWVLRPTG